MRKAIVARGIRVHNLNNINVEIPLRQLVVITGVSGSGKSSLAFDTLYAEGQRRYVESFSAYARQFLERIDKPDVDHIEGIPPAIAIEQKNSVKNRRSTVGTATEINDYLRLLFARIGKTYCEGCGEEVRNDTISQIAEYVLSLPEGVRLLVTFPISISKRISGKMQLAALRERGIIRILADKVIIDISSQSKNFNIHKFTSVAGVVDRLVTGKKIKSRLVDSLDAAYRLGHGYLRIMVQGNPDQVQPYRGRDSHIYKKKLVGLIIDDVEWTEASFSAYFRCSACDREYPTPTPHLFSFNNPLGACVSCQGFGHSIEIDMDLVIPDKTKTINEGAIAPWNSPSYSGLLEELQAAASQFNIPLDTPFNKLTKNQEGLIIEGTEEFWGIREFFTKLEKKKYKMHVRVFLSKYRAYNVCAECNGSRLNPSALHIKVDRYTITEICRMSIDEAFDFFQKLKLTRFETEMGKLILLEIKKRLGYMVKVGLGYLSLDRMTRTLSGGESQRVNLTTSLGASLVNTLYILDEPSIGLHPRDTKRLIKILKELRDIGNTVIVVEHDREIMHSCDFLVDLGPGAGKDGGNIVYRGSVKDIPPQTGSLTGQYLRGKRKIVPPAARRVDKRNNVMIRGASENNLQNVDVSFPLKTFTCVTGVSGSGKSTLVQDTLYSAIKRKFGIYQGLVGKHKEITINGHIDNVVLVDQSPIGRTPRSNPVTYVKVFDAMRKIFASTREAQRYGLTPGSFSFNVKGGRCDHCDGCGYVKVDMQFLADIYVTCDQCHGTRYRNDILEVSYKQKNICEVLEMTVKEAMDFFSDRPKYTVTGKRQTSLSRLLSDIRKGLQYLDDTGLGYLKLGQAATTLSGGEAQRLKLATYMARGRGEEILFIFDEPTSGLHFDDIRKLLDCFQKLIDNGHSIIVIEHNLDVIKCADYIIDLGPEGGDGGGFVVGCGTPGEIAKLQNSHTGKFLKKARA
ncbi:MAG: excinuclease ABC subunit UvrA [Candidatus Scalindua sp. AMX11]|nr:MAG: excinuclease ABC subunit UvrA [Candidatus Scalindua sp.]NOG83337.1 excinuclease ABC subunit UvrA [Planctomycetota bacterium]RZV76762.1 MAG: excinuclease ABC subunit UvrA [Candidatus Scalindua sp. SCAELEC01]TDE63946.1 MAG: excinuclease ABC subunit UvrA [Candidatus Scalindua sp. AMX11]GJQ60254.1 MAG: ABC-ATPase UvrA [Candidatus Scalindua sp.]